MYPGSVMEIHTGAVGRSVIDWTSRPQLCVCCCCCCQLLVLIIHNIAAVYILFLAVHYTFDFFCRTLSISRPLHFDSRLDSTTLGGLFMAASIL